MHRALTASTHFRPATPGDIARCIEIRGLTRENAVSASRLAELGITEASWSMQVGSDTLPGFVCTVEGRIVGYCFGSGGTGEVVVLAMLPQYEGLGLGKALLGLCMAELRSRGQTRLFLGCSANPAHRSHGFYRHLGWRPTGSVDAHGDEILEHCVAAQSDS